MANEIPKCLSDREAEQARIGMAKLRRGRASKKDSAPLKYYKLKSKDGSYRYVCL